MLSFVNVNAHIVSITLAILAEHLESATETIYDLQFSRSQIHNCRPRRSSSRYVLRQCQKTMLFYGGARQTSSIFQMCAHPNSQVTAHLDDV
jgi:hypothetical protein